MTPQTINSVILFVAIVTLVSLRRNRWWLRRCPRWLRVSFDRLGIEFGYQGDAVVWTWPWTRERERGAYISLGFTGNGDFGDARFQTLADLDRAWADYYRAENEFWSKEKSQANPFDAA